jgi:hypothetical protein
MSKPEKKYFQFLKNIVMAENKIIEESLECLHEKSDKIEQGIDIKPPLTEGKL